MQGYRTSNARNVRSPGRSALTFTLILGRGLPPAPALGEPFALILTFTAPALRGLPGALTKPRTTTADLAFAHGFGLRGGGGRVVTVRGLAALRPPSFPGSMAATRCEQLSRLGGIGTGYSERRTGKRACCG